MAGNPGSIPTGLPTGTGTGPGSTSTSDTTTSGTTTSTTTTSTSISTSSTSSSTSTGTSTSSTSTSSSTSSSTSISSTSTSTSSTSIPPTSTSTSTTAPVLPTTPISTGGVTITSTSTQFSSNTLGAAPVQTSAGSHASKSFFTNKGAVAGVFSVVGIVVVALLIALITNGIRRRRARKFDKELQEATLEAASAPKPIFLDDDDDDLGGGPGGPYGGRGGGGAYGSGGVGEYSDFPDRGGFSDVSSHGTYAQPPMSISSGHGGQMESYGMRELGPSSGGNSGGGVPGPVAGPAPGEIFDPYAMGAAAGVGGAAGAAGIGVARARSMKSSSPEGGQGGYGAALQEGGAPYAAFAAPPQYGGYDPYANPGSGVNSAQRNAEILEAAGMGAHLNGAGVGLNRGPSSGGAYGYQQQPGQQYSQEYNNVSPNLGRNRSLGGMGMAPVQESYDPYANASLSPPQQPLSASSGKSGATQYFSPATESYASHYQQSQSQSHSPPPPQGQVHAPNHQPGLSTVSAGGTDADDMDDAYGGYEAADDHDHDAGNKLPNPFANATSVEGGHGGYGGSRESRYSEDGDEIEEEPPRRVLKVANE